MEDEISSRTSTRRDTPRTGGAVGVALATGSALRGSATALDATPAAGGISTSIETITLDAATRLIEAAEQKSVEIGVPMATAIVGQGGLLKAFHWKDGLYRAVAVAPSQHTASPQQLTLARESRRVTIRTPQCFR